MTHEIVFPHGCCVMGAVVPVLDFDASTKDRPVAARDKLTSELMWAVPVLDADPDLKAAVKSLTVKVLSPVEPEIPEPPAELAGLPVVLVPVIFEGLTVTPYVGGNGRLAYSFKATGIRSATLTVARARGGAKAAQ
ncbi:plasmid replication, integration and excision activator (plasmid) [Actinomadura sp. ATCC 31491]|uniref:Plasmid replication, integration and excision activator n=1 Tax=Actinomadura luzonensis TaxID=2805427 RepID=A0ABT0FSC6_9ACTN|nr:plasmid replication, integration and excision activator [Actinomadura luzonensis]MCK2215246.1 plasmid replication, integration and excision activator [Actinomadura luzonensis]MCK2222026.1 plasmid replication, integration and excision activator [Actinomadura luzonensis]